MGPAEARKSVERAMARLGMEETHGIRAGDDLQHIASNRQGTPVVAVHGCHLQSQSDHAVIAAFVTVAVPGIPQALTNVLGDQRDHAKTVRQHLVRDGRRVLVE